MLQGLTEPKVSGYRNFSIWTPLRYSYATFGLCAEIVDVPSYTISYRVPDLEWGLNSFNWHYARFCILLLWTRNWNILTLLLYTIQYQYLMSKTFQNIQKRGLWVAENQIWPKWQLTVLCQIFYTFTLSCRIETSYVTFIHNSILKMDNYTMFHALYYHHAWGWIVQQIIFHHFLSILLVSHTFYNKLITFGKERVNRISHQIRQQLAKIEEKNGNKWWKMNLCTSQP